MRIIICFIFTFLLLSGCEYVSWKDLAEDICTGSNKCTSYDEDGDEIK